MKKRILFPAAMLCVALAGLFASCTKVYGDLTTMNYPITDSYTKLDISHAFDVTISDDVTEAVVTVPEDLHSKLKVKVKDGTLYIGFSPVWVVTGVEDCKAVLPRNIQLKDLKLSGASTFHGDLQGADSEIDISGASDFHGNVTAASVEFEISGASVYNGIVNCDDADVNLSGASKATIDGVCTGTMDVNISGASKLEASLFNTDAVTGMLSGASKADVTVCSRVAVSLSGASELTYGTSSASCHPVFECHCTGSSTVFPR